MPTGVAVPLHSWYQNQLILTRDVHENSVNFLVGGGIGGGRGGWQSSILLIPCASCLIIIVPVMYVLQISVMLPSLPRKGSLFTLFLQTFCERCLGPCSALDKLFSHSCDLHVLPVVLISSQPTHT